MTEKMRPEIKAKWIAALNSGEYEQGNGFLNEKKSDDATGETVSTFCCLGVLCDLAVKEGIDIVVQEKNGLTSYGTRSDTAFLPREVRVWAGLDSSEGAFEGSASGISADGTEVRETNLIGLNDSNVPFAAIAAVIDEKF